MHPLRLVSAANSFEAFNVEVGASIFKLNVPRTEGTIWKQIFTAS
jgi:hypothetical protein